MKKYAILFLCGFVVSLQASQKSEGSVKVQIPYKGEFQDANGLPSTTPVTKFKHRTSEASNRFVQDTGVKFETCVKKPEKPAPKD